tara:strand:+ start:2692 stop:3717 length:1026 start_codon:yes stop_codon:yes gene_type:complete
MVNFELRYALRQPQAKGDKFQDRYQACLDQCQWADALGFSSVMLSEHHGSPDGYMSSPMVVGGAIAGITKRMRIRIVSLVGPLHNPVRLAEDLATLDILSNGRLEVCISAGYVGYEFEAMGTDLSKRKEYMDSIVPFLHMAWLGEPFEWKGKTLRVTPRPVQRPHPPIWMGGSSKAAARRAARFADIFYPAYLTGEKYEMLMSTYLSELESLGRQPADKLQRSLLVWVAEDKEEFWSRFGESALHENNSYGKLYTDWGAWNGYEKEKDIKSLRSKGLYPIVTPEELVQKILERKGKPTTVMFHPMAGGADPGLAWEGLHLLESKVIPELKKEGIILGENNE